MPASEAYRDEDWLRQRVREGRTPSEIAKLCSVTTPTIKRWIDRHDVKPYRDKAWLQGQIEQYVSEQAIAEWCNVNERTIERWMAKFDIDHPGLVPAQVMESVLTEKFGDRDDVSEEVLISVLWERYKTRVTHAEIARAVGVTPKRVRQVVGDDFENIRTEITDSLEFLGSERVPRDIAQEVKERDGGTCVRCGATNNLELHHVIPGESTPSNLAVLCRDCHEVAHQGDFYTAHLAYDSRSEFWDKWTRS